MKKTDESYRIFEAIRANDYDRVRELVEAEPELVNAVAPKKPADTRGMSPLQVALCTGWHIKIAWYLLDNGADVNYLADKKWTDESRPVLFDAVDGALWNSRRYAWDGNTSGPVVLVWKHTKEEADEAFRFLREMIRCGADVNKTDYYGRNSLMEAVAEANRFCPIMNAETGEYYPGRPITPEMREDFLRIFNLLADAGADKNNISAYSKKSIREHFGQESVWQICADVFDGAD